MSKTEVIELMKSSRSEREWNENCNKVKSFFSGQYPDYWYSEVILSGLCNRVLGEGADQIQIIPIN